MSKVFVAKAFAPLLALAVLAPSLAHALAVSAVTDPRPAHHAVDVTGTLGPDELKELDLLAKDASQAGELFVVVIPSTDGIAPHAWATSLFNRLHLDTGARNRAVLLMVALNDHKAEIILGDGWPAGTSSITDGIVTNDVVVHFTAGDPRGAVVVGARAIVHNVIVPRPIALVPQTIAVPHPIAPGAHAAPPRAATEEPVLGGVLLQSMLGFGALFALFFGASKLKGFAAKRRSGP